MTDEEITDENYCDWRQSNCPLVKDYRARIAELEAALKPFADVAEEVNAINLRYRDIEIWVTVGDLRAAAAALKETGDE